MKRLQDFKLWTWTRRIALCTSLVLSASGIVTGYAGNALGTTIIVTSTAPDTGGPDCKIRDAISAANTSSVVGGCDGTGGPPFILELQANAFYSLRKVDNQKEREGSNGLPRVTGNLTVNGRGATIERQPDPDENYTLKTFRFFQVEPGGTLRLIDLTLQRGKEDLGGAVFNQGVLRAKEVTFYGNAGGCGGAVYNYPKSNLNLADSSFIHNEASS
jgi:hypothetical protein